MTPFLALGDSRENLVLWLAAPVLGLVLLILAIVQVPGYPCEGGLMHFYDDGPERGFVIGVTVVLSLLLGIATANCWAAQRRRRRLPVPPLPEAIAALAIAVGAAALVLFPALGGVYAVVAVPGSAAAVVGFFAVLDMQVKGVDLRNASRYLPIYLGASAVFLYPLLTLATLHFTTHPFCGFD